MTLFLQEDEELVRRSAWILGHCAEAYPSLMQPWLKPLLKKMQKPGVHCAVKRNGVRILQFVDIPRGLRGTVTNLCFAYLTSLDEPIAVRTFSMTVIAKIAEHEPELRKELELTVRQFLPYSSPAFRARAKRILKNHENEEGLSRVDELWARELSMGSF
jgi:hypothetical protein